MVLVVACITLFLITLTAIKHISVGKVWDTQWRPSRPSQFKTTLMNSYMIFTTVDGAILTKKTIRFYNRKLRFKWRSMQLLLLEQVFYRQNQFDSGQDHTAFSLYLKLSPLKPDWVKQNTVFHMKLFIFFIRFQCEVGLLNHCSCYLHHQWLQQWTLMQNPHNLRHVHTRVDEFAFQERKAWL